MLPALLDWRRGRDTETRMDGWRYRVAWQPLSGLPARRATGTWLAVLPASGADDAWTDAVLDGLGTSVVRMRAESTERAELAARVRTFGSGFDGVLSLLALDDRTDDDAAPAGTVGTAALVQALGDAGLTAPLWCVTRGAVAVGAADAAPAPRQAAVWGLGRVAALEYPDRWGGLVDLPSAVPGARELDALGAVLAGHDGEDQVAVRGAAAFAGRIVPAPADGRDADAAAWQPSGTTLITGGTGALAAHVARRLAKAGAPHLVLAGRRGPDAPGAAALRDELTGLGARVTLAACDVADRGQLTELLAGIPQDLPLTAVVHTAGVVDDGVLERLTPERFGRVFRAKAASALLLDELTRDSGLEVFALFSSATALVGNPGQANYAAANAVLDALAERRRAEGLPATSIAWGVWGGGGMAGGAAAEEAMRRVGIEPMDPELAAEMLCRLVTEPHPTALVAGLASGAFAGPAAGRPRALLRGLPGHDRPQDTAERAAEPVTDLRERLAKLPPARRTDTVLDLVLARSAAVLGHRDASAIGAERLFRDLGVDSLGAVELRNQLTAATGLPLAATLAFDHPTPLALAQHLTGHLAPEAPDTPVSPDGTPEDARIRSALARLPLDRLRESGLLDELLALGTDNGATAPPADPEPDADIDAMALDDLVRAALTGHGAGPDDPTEPDDSAGPADESAE